MPIASTARPHFGGSSENTERNDDAASPIHPTGSIVPSVEPIWSATLIGSTSSLRSEEITSGSPGMSAFGSNVCPS
ncbi:hypothetical protein BJF85_15405 [Saccharomonospora sp. CUA-673]|nr:hypothetical protein BJF85_15405 [Saccharomonospora sp. CUA-673]